MARLRALIPSLPGAHLCVAFSGGGDSTALLGALAAARTRGRFALRALHVDHGLHPQSRRWARQACALAASLGVPCEVLRVDVVVPRGASLEARAREARYSALAAALVAGEWLLTAHHAEDQAETLLLQLLRGAGLAGLAAMPVTASFDAAPPSVRLLRPLLGCPREQLRSFARRRRLPWLEDPANADLRLDRNYLRARVMPVLLERWTGAVRTLGRSAGHLAAARTLLSTPLGAALADARDGSTLSIPVLRRWSAAWRAEIVRAWLMQLDAPLPDQARLRELCTQMLYARADAVPVVHWAGVQVCRHDNRLHLVRESPPPGHRRVVWTWRREPCLTLPDGSALWMQSHERGAFALDALPARLAVHVGAPSQPRVAKRLQQAGIAPWERARVPLVCAGDTLIAIADLWIEAAYRAPCAPPRRAGARAHLRWIRPLANP